MLFVFREAKVTLRMEEEKKAQQLQRLVQLFQKQHKSCLGVPPFI